MIRHNIFNPLSCSMVIGKCQLAGNAWDTPFQGNPYPEVSSFLLLVYSNVPLRHVYQGDLTSLKVETLKWNNHIALAMVGAFAVGNM